MGLDRIIRFAGDLPDWEVIRTRLAQVGETPTLRMIDGMPAFPDEVPEPGWKELRVGFQAGMVSLRRDGTSLVAVVWGNADAALRAAWDKLTWAAAAAGGGLIDTPHGATSPEAFATDLGLNPG